MLQLKIPKPLKHIIWKRYWLCLEYKVKLTYHAEWTMVTQTIKWDPEIRYDKISLQTRIDAENMLNSVKTLLKIL